MKILQQKLDAIKSLFNKRTEIHYNSWYITTQDHKKIKIELKGKIKCPVLNTNISSLTCSKLMDKAEWPRGICPTICEENQCFINKSILKFKATKKTPNDLSKK